MSDDWTPDESWLAGAFDEVGLPLPPNRGQLGSHTPKRGHRMRAAAAMAVVGAVAAAAIGVPRLVASAPVHRGLTSACEVALPPSWLRAADGHLPGSAQGLIPFAVSPNGKWLFASVERHAWSGVVEVNVNNGVEHRIEQFASPVVSNKSPSGSAISVVDEVGGGSFDGRWLVWTQLQYLPNDAQTTPRKAQNDVQATSVMAWDSRLGKVWTVQAPVSTTVVMAQDTAKDAGLVVWGVSSGADKQLETWHIYSLRAHRVRGDPTQTADPYASFFWGNDLILESVHSRSGALAWAMTAISLSADRRIPITLVLRGLDGLPILGAGPGYVVAAEISYPHGRTSNARKLYTIKVLRRGSEQPYNLVRLRAVDIAAGSLLTGDGYSNFPFDGYLTLDDAPSRGQGVVVLALDLSSGAYVAFPPQKVNASGAAVGRYIDSALGGGPTMLVVDTLRGGELEGDAVGVLHLNRLPSLGRCA